MDPLVIPLSDTFQLVLGPEHLGLVAGVILLLAVAGWAVGRRATTTSSLDDFEAPEELDGLPTVPTGGTPPKQTASRPVQTGFMAGFARSRAALAEQLSKWAGGDAGSPELDPARGASPRQRPAPEGSQPSR